MAVTTTYIQKEHVQSLNIVSLKMAASTTLYKGTLVAINISGLAVAAADTANFVLGGVALEQKTNGSTAGATEIKVARDGRFEFAIASTTQASVGQPCYMVDNNTVGLAATTTNDVRVGTITRLISATKVEVELVIV